MTTAIPKIAHSYKRFSSIKQRKSSSLKRQSDALDKYVSEHQLTLSDTTFEDLGVSAYRSTNAKEDKGLGQFLHALRSGAISTPCTLIVESLDRLSRAKIKVAMRQLMDITDMGVAVVTLVDGRVYTEDMEFEDFIMAGVIMQRANEESLTKSQRLKSKWEERRQKGFVNANCPFWLVLKADRSGYAPNEYASTVEMIFALTLQGLGSRLVAQSLNDSGIPAPKGGKWSTGTISKVLNNVAVYGALQPHTREYDDKTGKRTDKKTPSLIANFYPAILPESLFNETLAVRRSRNKTFNRNSTNSHLNLIKEVGHCGGCGGNVRLKKQQDLYYLQCSVECGKCSPVSLRYLQDWLKEIWLTADYAPVSLASVPEAKQLNALKDDLNAFNRKSSKLNELYAITEDENTYNQLLIIGKEIKVTKAKIEDLETELSPYSQTQAARKERTALVSKAFESGDALEVLAARGKLASLLTQLKDFVIHKDKKSQLVTFEVKTAQNETKIYVAAKNPYHAKSSHTGAIWKAIEK
ncbi:recombinase family protein [Vibrio rotiferianus]|nr:recombinase family protein [Vibrio rotiferianus]